MHDSGNYYYWGMHAGWWIFTLVIVIVLVGAVYLTRKRR
ncbi:hypothetical protein C8N25_13124 [Algoriphagus antarcticus]|uniref:Uncharacterized protein n=1 Tax=Algoriphagus antarcticus TaxID=238540 RepID=A0A3E0D9X3_9BACT|nr:hypothetical protein C8N25_13124 [Algoriphagus antarcticus]